VIQQGQVFKLKATCADGSRCGPTGIALRAAVRRGCRWAGSAAGLRRRGRFGTGWLARLLPDRRAAALTLGEWVEEYLDAHDGERVTVAKLRWLLGKATAELGEVRLTELSPEQVCAWRLTVPEGHRFEATQALRQVLNRAVAWKLIDENPAKRGVPNPGRRCREQRPFDSRAQIRSVAERLGSSFGPMVVFAAATGLRPSELFALEQGDVDRASAVVHVRRAYANGRVKDTKTRLSRRAVPLQAIALEALDQLRPPGGEPAAGSEHTRRPPRLPQLQPPALETGPEKSRDRAAARPLRPTPRSRSAPVFVLSRFMGTSIAMINLHYGHLAVDSYQHAVSLLDALALERAVDAGWTPPRRPAKPHSDTLSRPRGRRLRRAVDARWTSRSESVTTRASRSCLLRPLCSINAPYRTSPRLAVDHLRRRGRKVTTRVRSDVHVGAAPPAALDLRRRTHLDQYGRSLRR
jgi:integrase